MQQKKNFGRREAPDGTHQTARPLIPKVVARRDDAEPAPHLPHQSINDDSSDVDRELQEWKVARKRQRRSFREPWRSLSIATSIGFGASFWLLPDSVANVVQYVTGGLAAATFLAGFRSSWKKPSAPIDKIEPTA
jgi:hypothetical protein